jgi:hypothetical protein
MKETECFCECARIGEWSAGSSGLGLKWWKGREWRGGLFEHWREGLDATGKPNSGLVKMDGLIDISWIEACLTGGQVGESREKQ